MHPEISYSPGALGPIVFVKLAEQKYQQPNKVGWRAFKKTLISVAVRIYTVYGRGFTSKARYKKWSRSALADIKEISCRVKSSRFTRERGAGETNSTCFVERRAVAPAPGWSRALARCLLFASQATDESCARAKLRWCFVETSVHALRQRALR